MNVIRLLAESLNEEQMQDCVLDFMESALREGLYDTSPENLLIDILNDLAQAWVIVENETILGVCVSEIAVIENHKELVVVALAGNGFEEYKNELDEVLTNFAKHNECENIRTISRRGMVRKLKHLGYVEDLVILKKHLNTVH